ncbi:MAG: hypothetical protein WC205_18855 [Opitutaceae bacterium]
MLVLSLMPEARSRLNTLYMMTRVVGGAIGSLVGAYAWSHSRWPAVCASALGMNALALTIHFVAKRREVSAGEPVGQGA